MHDQLTWANGKGENRAGGEADDGSSSQAPWAPVSMSYGSGLLCLPFSHDLKATMIPHPQSPCLSPHAFNFFSLPCHCIVPRNGGSEGEVEETFNETFFNEHLEKKIMGWNSTNWNRNKISMEQEVGGESQNLQVSERLSPRGDDQRQPTKQGKESIRKIRIRIGAVGQIQLSEGTQECPQGEMSLHVTQNSEAGLPVQNPLTTHYGLSSMNISALSLSLVLCLVYATSGGYKFQRCLLPAM